MNIWLDTEFNEFRGDLISIGMIDENGREFYEVLSCASPKEWVAQNVMPVLGKAPIELTELRIRFAKWLSMYPQIQVHADWPEGIKHFCELQISGPGECVRLPMQYFAIHSYLNTSLSETPHNAIADARALRAMHLKMLGEGR